jgi:hypothetical protein
MPQNSDLKQLPLTKMIRDTLILLVRRQKVEEEDARSVAAEVQINTDLRLACPRNPQRGALNSSRRESMSEVSSMDTSLLALPTPLKVSWQLVLLMTRGCGVVRWTRRKVRR